MVLRQSSITVQAYRKARQLDDYSEARLRQNLKQAIMQRFNVRESHHRGRVFCGLALRVAGGNQTSAQTAAGSSQGSAAGKANSNSSAKVGPDGNGRSGQADAQNPTNSQEC